MQATNMQFTLDEDQWEQDWASVLSLASQPGASLEQTHVFALAHIIRRPIIIYGVKFVRSFRGETLGLARFQGRGVTEHIFLFTLFSHLTNENKLNLPPFVRCVPAFAVGEKFLLEKSDCSGIYKRALLSARCYGDRTTWCCRCWCPYRQQ